MYSEDDLLPISLLQHYVFCPRRAALIGIEQHWSENEATMDGMIMHEKAHREIAENRPETRTRNSLRLHSLALGLSGIADVVEFHKAKSEEEAKRGIDLPKAEGKWIPFPIEYKRGTTHDELPYQIQLCAQTLCLEEMLEVPIVYGAIFWGENRRRQEIEFDYDLRKATVNTIEDVRTFIGAGKTPQAHFEKKCKGCSLYDVCMPKVTQDRDAEEYFREFFRLENE